jgi:hypothetical protein
MKNHLIRTLFALTFLVAAFTNTQAQSSTGIHSFFKGTATDVKASVQANTLTFFVSGIENEQQLADFIKRSTPYSKGFTMTVANTDSQKRECKIKFTGTPDLKWVERFFMAASITDVELNASVMSPSAFFNAVK